ncbi:MAG: hypothetical protein F2641_05810 [Actinobacteria bacterium]|nr:hypothetical protein [Actinomycetota bacterium]MSY38943.1 hypothetical protein [Actinomycetota bacterium]
MFGKRQQPLRYLTVVTYGRTGSTALQSALNTLPGVLIRGENYSALRGLETYVQAIAETADRHHAKRSRHPWFGSAKLNAQAVLDDQRRHVVDQIFQPSKDSVVVGFKEVRYEPGHFESYEVMLSYLLFLNKLFPGITYVINVREPEDAALSGWWPNHEDPIAALTQSRDWLVDATHDLNTILGAQQAHLLNYEQWQDNPEALIEAFHEMQLPRNDDGVRAALAVKLEHGPRTDENE